MSHKHKHRVREVPRMSTLEELEALYTSTDIPVVPLDGFKKPNKKSPTGYSYYQRIRERLPEWWESFNGSLNSHGGLKYGTIKEFIKKKARQGSEREFLYQMLGPASKHDTGVPWLGDWEKRRRNGFGLLDNPGKIRPLIQAIKSNVAAADSIKSLTPVLVEELVQYSNLQKQVHEAFAGRAFISGKTQDHKRFNAYKTMLWALTELKVKILHEIIRCHGVDPHQPQQMRDMAQIAGGIGAAAALTGIAAGQRIPGLGVTTSSGQIAPYTYDSLKLAEHLTRHAHTFKKPLPIIEGEEVEHDPSSSSSKTNGRTQ